MNVAKAERGRLLQRSPLSIDQNCTVQPKICRDLCARESKGAGEIFQLPDGCTKHIGLYQVAVGRTLDLDY